MQEIELSTLRDLDASAGMGPAFFDNFAAQNKVNVKRKFIDWADAWNSLAQVGLNARGPDVSEVGSTWLGGYHAMDALRPFRGIEAPAMQSYPPATWRSCIVGSNNVVIGVPWTLDIRIVLYRRDWLQKAGVSETTAFIDAGHFYETLKKVRAAGHPAPLGLTTSRTVTRLFHDMASWVWSAGGDIRSENGRRMLLREPNSRAGMEAYFQLNEFISPEMFGLSEPDVAGAFLDGKTAVAVVNDHTYYRVVRKIADVVADVAENLGVAVLLKNPFIGGTALVIWQHTFHVQESLKLIQCLGSVETGKILLEQYHFLPANTDSLKDTFLLTDPFFPVIQKSLQQGRSVHSGFRWGGVEARLVWVVEQMWNDLHANPGLNIACEVERRFTELFNRLEQTILASYG